MAEGVGPSGQLRRLNPQPEEAVGDQERAIVPINGVLRQQGLNGALGVGKDALRKMRYATCVITRAWRAEKSNGAHGGQ